MKDLLLVRHAQAAFGTDDYDRLTHLGPPAGALAGQLLPRARNALRPGVSRNASSPPGNAGRDRGGRGDAGTCSVRRPTGRVRSRATGRSARGGHGRRARAARPPRCRRHGRCGGHTSRLISGCLRDALTGWTLGQLDPPPTAASALSRKRPTRLSEVRVRRTAVPVGRVLVVSSGGPISSIVAHHLGMPASSFVALNLQVRNSGFCEIQFNDAAPISSASTTCLIWIRRREERTSPSPDSDSSLR